MNAKSLHPLQVVGLDLEKMTNTDLIRLILVSHLMHSPTPHYFKLSCPHNDVPISLVAKIR